MQIANCRLKDKLNFRFAHLSDNQDEIHVEENVPWGEDTLFTLEFREESNKYAVHTCNNMYLQRDGKLVPAVNKVAKLIYHFYKIQWAGKTVFFVSFSLELDLGHIFVCLTLSCTFMGKLDLEFILALCSTWPHIG